VLIKPWYSFSWQLPGGFLHKKDSPLERAGLQLLRETGLPKEMVGKRHFVSIGFHVFERHLDYYFRIRVPGLYVEGTELPAVDPHLLPDKGWHQRIGLFSREEVTNLDLSPETTTALGQVDLAGEALLAEGLTAPGKTTGQDAI